MRFSTLLFLLFTSIELYGQSVYISKPMQGFTTDTTATLWVEVRPSVTRLEINCLDGQRTVYHRDYSFTDTPILPFRPLTFHITHLVPGNNYTYQLNAYTKNNNEIITGTLKNGASDTWQKQEPGKTFSFITGSCAVLDDKLWEKTGILYKGDTSIFYRMAHTPADFMLWLGDNWYTGKGEYETYDGLLNKAHRTREAPVLHQLEQAYPHYAIWDDHDFGPDNSGASYKLKYKSRDIFMNYWPAPSYGENNTGIYTKFKYNGVAFFLMDDRMWRSGEGNLNYLRYFAKNMFGKQQMEWLKRSLLEERDAPFKIITTGTQVLAHHANRDCMRRFPKEFHELMRFIADNKINGVVFLTGDRHFTEIVKEERKGYYPLYDITISAFTSGPEHPAPHEKRSKRLVPGTLYEDHNFAKITVTDGKKLHVDIINTKGVTVGQWEVTSDELAN